MNYKKIMLLFASMLLFTILLCPEISVKAEYNIGVESDTEVDMEEDEEEDSGSGSGFWLLELGELLLDIPAAIGAFITGFSGVTSAIKELLQVLFPFLPGLVINIFIVMMYFMVALAVWKLIK